jgi:viral phosphatase
MRNNWALVKRHILFLNEHQDLQLVPRSLLDRIEFVIFKGGVIGSDYGRLYKCNIMTTDDSSDMREFRRRLKTSYALPYLGHLFTIYARPATYELLNEWLVYDVTELGALTSRSHFFDPPHVVVFDMDSTLITEEEEVQIRDPAIYESLEELQRKNCVLCLWSYGDRQHVVDSLQKLQLEEYFSLILAEGRKSGEHSTSASVDTKYDVFYKNTPFYLNVDYKCLPKSPRVILWYLQKKGINFIKTITLVDDLLDNDYNYDNFVHLRRCPVPINDWHEWHSEIVGFIDSYDYIFAQ